MTLDNWCQQCEALQQTDSLKTIWALYQQGIHLLSDDMALSPCLYQTLRYLIVNYLIPIANNAPSQLHTYLQQILRDLQQESDQLISQYDIPIETIEHHLFQLQMKLSALSPVLSILAKRSWDPFTNLRVHLKLLEQDIQRQGILHPTEPLLAQQQTDIDNTRLQLLEGQISTFIQEAQARCHTTDTEQSPQTCSQYLWQTSQYGEFLLVALHEAAITADCLLDPKVQNDLQQLQKIVDVLEQQTLDTVRNMSAVNAKQWAEQRMVALCDMGTEALATAENRTLETAAFNFQRLDQQIQHFSRLCPTLDNCQSLYKVSKQLHNEWVEKTVSLQLKQRFGKKFERHLDSMILVSIIIVIGLLILDLMTSLSSQAKMNLLVIDTIICVVFLFEFSLRLWVAPDRNNFFKRHWFTDLLPAIPFGLFHIWLESLLAVTQHATILRILRLPALALKKLKPLIKLFRIVILAIRGMDRLARRHQRLLNRDIIFFEPPPKRNATAILLEKADRLNNQLRAKRLDLLKQLTIEHLLVINQRDLAHYAKQADVVANIIAWPETNMQQNMVRTGSTTRQIRVENVIDQLIRIHDADIGAALGADFNEQASRLVKVAKLPLLRWFPFFSDVVKAQQEATNPSELAVLISRKVGYRLQKINERILFVADLHGVITAPQLVDRIGNTLIMSLKRPAIRLIMFGSIFIIITGLIGIVESSWLESASNWLRDHLGIPIMVLGGISGIGVLLGIWLQRLASSATDFYARAAEAHFISLLKDVKRARAGHDHAVLQQRVLIPEMLVQGLRPAPIENTNVEISLDQDSAPLKAFRDMIRHSFVLDNDIAKGSLAERIYLLYRHYISGAPLHRSDTNTTSQLLGNLCLQNVIQRILRLDKKTQKQLHALDLEQASGIGGPSMWFNFITLAIAQRAGQLVEDYNRHAIPAIEKDMRSKEEVHRFNWWLNNKQGHDQNFASPATSQVDYYSTSIFTVLDFLTNDPQRDQAIAERFGKDVQTLVAKDRRLLIREVFGTYPYHTRSIQERSINCHTWYWQYLGGGRVLLLPIVLIRMVWRYLKQFSAWFKNTLSELLNPQLRNRNKPEVDIAGYEVAVRKIHRMRKPVFLAMMKLRAMLDVEYLGLYLPGQKHNGLESATIYQDLDLLELSVIERAPFLQLIKSQHCLLREFYQYLQRSGLQGEGLTKRLAQLNPKLVKRQHEVLRALTNAYVTNFHDLRELIHNQDNLQTCINDAIVAQGHLPYLKRPLFWGQWIVRWLLSKRQRQAYRNFRQHCLANYNLKDWKYIRNWWVADNNHLRRLAIVAASAEYQPSKKAETIVQHIITHPTSWTEHLVTMRTIQSFTLLDIASDKYMVRNLGEYDSEDEHAIVYVPTL